MLNRENKPKNPGVVIPNGNSSIEVISNSSFQKVQMGGAKDANDTPVSVEAEAKSYREIIETSNELPTITYDQSPMTNELHTITYAQSPMTNELPTITYAQSLVANELPTWHL